MARLVNGINGPIIGKLGAVVGSSRNGKPYLKGKYKNRTTKVSRTEMANRNKFGMAQAWLRPLLHFLREGFKGYSETAQGFVAAKSHLLRNAFVGTAPDIAIDPALAKLAIGQLAPPTAASVELTGNGMLKFAWDKGTDYAGNTSIYDQAMLMAYDIENGAAYFNLTGQFRKTQEDFLQIYNTAGRTYHIYMAFAAADRSIQSDSVYLGEISI